MLTIGALLAGVALADVFTPRAPLVMSVAGAGACGLLFVIGRSCAKTPASPWASAGVMVVGVFVFGFLLLLGMHLTGRPSGYGLQGFLTRVLLALLVGGTATLLPLVITIVALRPLKGEVSSPAANLGLVAITAALSTATLIVSFLIFVSVLCVSPGPYRLIVSLVTVLLTPTFLLPMWTYLYVLILSRWRVPPSSLLLDAAAAVRERLGVEFGRIICLGSEFGGNTCQIVLGFRSSTLVVSELLAETLTREETLAVLVHEAAHVRLRHLQKRLAWGAVRLIAIISGSVLAQVFLVPLAAPIWRFSLSLATLLPLLVARALYVTRVIRAHEAEADELAVAVTGATPLLNALQKLGGAQWARLPMHNRWTSHGTWTHRVSLIRRFERSAHSEGDVESVEG